MISSWDRSLSRHKITSTNREICTLCSGSCRYSKFALIYDWIKKARCWLLPMHVFSIKSIIFFSTECVDLFDTGCLSSGSDAFNHRWQKDCPMNPVIAAGDAAGDWCDDRCQTEFCVSTMAHTRGHKSRTLPIGRTTHGSVDIAHTRVKKSNSGSERALPSVREHPLAVILLFRNLKGF